MSYVPLQPLGSSSAMETRRRACIQSLASVREQMAARQRRSSPTFLPSSSYTGSYVFLQRSCEGLGQLLEALWRNLDSIVEQMGAMLRPAWQEITAVLGVRIV